MIGVADQVWVVNWIYDFTFERLTLFDPGRCWWYTSSLNQFLLEERNGVTRMQHIRDIYQMRINSELKVVSRLFSMAWGADGSL